MKKDMYGRHKDTWNPLKCRMVPCETTVHGKKVKARKCDCDNCPNNKKCGKPIIHRNLTEQWAKIWSSVK